MSWLSSTSNQPREIADRNFSNYPQNDELMSLLNAIAIAQETEKIINENIGISVLPNLIALGLASTVGIHPLIATIIHNGSAILAGLNGLKPLAH